MMKCFACGRRFLDGELAVPLLKHTAARRGDFFGINPVGYLHLRCVKDL